MPHRALTCTACGEHFALPAVEESLWVDCPHCDARIVHPEAIKRRPTDSPTLENLRHGSYALMLLSVFGMSIGTVACLLADAVDLRSSSFPGWRSYAACTSFLAALCAGYAVLSLQRTVRRAGSWSVSLALSIVTANLVSLGALAFGIWICVLAFSR